MCRKRVKIPYYMIGVIRDNIDELQKVTSLEKEIIELKDYYDMNDFTWYLATSFTQGDIFNLLIWCYETAYHWDNTVIEFSTYLYNKYFPNNPKYPKTDAASRFKRVELKEEDINGAF